MSMIVLTNVTSRYVTHSRTFYMHLCTYIDSIQILAQLHYLMNSNELRMCWKFHFLIRIEFIQLRLYVL